MSPQVIAQEQMKFFQLKNIKLLESVEGANEVHPLETLKMSVNKWEQAGKQVPSMSLKEVSNVTILKHINNLKNSNAWGFDEVETKMVKITAKHLSNPITFLTNLSLSTATFPNKWKLGRILPQYKGKRLPKTNPSSYRPITLLPTISKIVERVVQE